MIYKHWLCCLNTVVSKILLYNSEVALNSTKHLKRHFGTFISIKIIHLQKSTIILALILMWSLCKHFCFFGQLNKTNLKYKEMQKSTSRCVYSEPCQSWYRTHSTVSVGEQMAEFAPAAGLRLMFMNLGCLRSFSQLKRGL